MIALLISFSFSWLLTIVFIVVTVLRHDKFISEIPKIESQKDYYKKFNN